MEQERSLRQWYTELSELAPDADAVAKRRRGYDFEKVLKGLLESEGLEPRSSYKSPGEQIDGSFYLDGGFLLLEAKWHADPIPASTLYQFKGKVDGKLVGTLGVFISMSGYSADAVDALIAGKSLNLILFTKEDMDAAIIQEIGFKQILKEKLRKAAEEGLAFYPIVTELVKTSASEPVHIERAHYDRVTGKVLRNGAQPAAPTDLIIVCESDTDREVLANIVQRILSGSKTAKKIEIISALGKISVPRIANSLLMANPDIRVLTVVDSDNDVAGSQLLLSNNIEPTNWAPIIIDPQIEEWLGLSEEEMRRLRRNASRLNRYLQAVEQLDIDQLRKADPAFDSFYHEVLSA
ncbi:restriction endonuclease [Pseudomonas sp. RA_5y_Pfl1_P24]|uniref:restriction endonuclease n=1 Tax=Pseudomonas sp. RA_5y_Pfl1_P24 TaxID=3088706 RepID=UPI0030D8799C